MKITKLGTIPTNYTLKGTCFRCQTEIECTSEETKTVIDNDRAINVVLCPTCEYDIIVWRKQ